MERVSLRSRVQADRRRADHDFLSSLPFVIGKVFMGAVAGVAIVAMLAVM